MSDDEAQLLESDHERDSLNGEHGSLSNKNKMNTVDPGLQAFLQQLSTKIDSIQAEVGKVASLDTRLS